VKLTPEVTTRLRPWLIREYSVTALSLVFAGWNVWLGEWPVAIAWATTAVVVGIKVQGQVYAYRSGYGRGLGTMLAIVDDDGYTLSEPALLKMLEHIAADVHPADQLTRPGDTGSKANQDDVT